MEKFFKKFAVLVGVVGFGLFVLFLEPERFGICQKGIYSSCIDVTNGLAEMFIPLVSFFFLSLITYFMRDEVFKPWLYFSAGWIPLSMVAVFLSPEYSNDWFLPMASKGGIAFLSSLLFVIVSVIIIVVQYVKVWRNKT